MNKTLLCSVILTVLSTPLCAADAPAPTETSPATPVQTDAPNQAQATPASEAPSNQPINCDYKIPAEKSDISTSLVQTWAEYATVKSFEMDASTLDQQMIELEKCFTKQGWEGFHTALEKSGNLNAIKTQKLTVSSQVDGQVRINPAKANQWKVTIPLEVVYQNDKQKLTQLLSVDALIGRKVSGDLGIMQLIATPRVAGESKSGSSTTESSEPAKDSEER